MTEQQKETDLLKSQNIQVLKNYTNNFYTQVYSKITETIFNHNLTLFGSTRLRIRYKNSIAKSNSKTKTVVKTVANRKK